MPTDGLASLPGYVASARVDWLALSVLIASCTFVLRAARWRLLLRAEGGGTPPWSAAWHATAIGFMANNVLPFRLGEVVRAGAVSRLGGPRLPAAIASVAVERIFDALTVVGLFALAIAGQQVATGLSIGNTSASRLITIVAILGVAALVAAGVAALFPAAAERWLRRLVPWPRLADRLAGPLHDFAHGLQVLHDPKRIALVIAGSVALWVVNAWSFGVAFRAFGLPSGLQVSLIVQMFVVFGVALPAAPGYVGVFEGGIAVALALFAVPHPAAFAVALTYHVLTYIPITLLGVWSLYRTGLKLGDLRAAPAPERPRPGEDARPSAQ